ncbi:P-loop containing nucleoside triphosphate hydrolase protein [Coprinopsis marcescibilis]|uniref:P-loop containing nucleoside triphosphate hydrolase protein n=1 Tax=Coprinopsis marcescibilis TaxID=230819 RepID=A0A5C3KPD6_COPMA|nr:P-loop containing nucleoside triphosphate hydrolase protein [Coprinopsis marcescibilis]
MLNPTQTRVITIGVGGATSSGKTTLAKHLRKCLHGSVIIHQDDFVPPAEQLPVDPEYGFADWDSAPTAIDWDRMSAFLSELRKTGELPGDHQSFDSFNETGPVPIDDDVVKSWKEKSEKLAGEYLEKRNEKIVWVLIDGFLMYWDERVVSNLDTRVFLRVPEDIARARRESRSYFTPEGDTWTDPPNYWEKIVWPAYINAHKHLFENEDAKSGGLSGKVKDVILFESTEAKMVDMVNTVMEKALEFSGRELST